MRAYFFYAPLLFFVALFRVASTSAATFVLDGAVMGSDTVWSAADSPYVIQGAVEVAVGAALTIEPGVVVKFADKARLIVRGRMRSLGNSVARVSFTSLFNDALSGDTNADGAVTSASRSDNWSIDLLGPAAGGETSRDVPEPHMFSFTDFSFMGGGLFMDSTAAFFHAVALRDSDAGIYAAESNVEIKETSADDISAILVADAGSRITVDSVSATDAEASFLIALDNSSLHIASSEFARALSNAALVNIDGDVSIENTTFSGGTGDGILTLLGGFGVRAPQMSLASSTVENFAGRGIVHIDGALAATSSALRGNRIGLESHFLSPRSSARFYNGAIVGSTSYGVLNHAADGVASTSTLQNIDARFSWWGSASGPMHHALNPTGVGDKILNGVLFAPWLQGDPTSCCSNILFIPGVSGSRLYRFESGGENRLWEPNRNADVEKLFMNDRGESVDPSIYTNDIIDTAVVLRPGFIFGVDIYKPAIDLFDQFVSDWIIEEWRSAPYDWRLDLRDIVSKPIALSGGGSYTMTKLVEELAARSRTGRVSIVAHSMGGLVAKSLADELVRRDLAYLIDKIVLVGSPQFGTPLAINSMLHGDGQDIPNEMGFIVSKVTARELGERMLSAYELLPSSRYFVAITDPMVEFDPTAELTAGLRALYGDALNSESELEKFLLGDGGARTEPPPSEIDTPNVLRHGLLSRAKVLQDNLDIWQPPLGVELHQIAGWGLDSVRGLRYGERVKNVCNATLSACIPTKVLDRKPLFSIEGDKTVLSPSAVALSGFPRWYVDFFRYNKGLRKNREHSDMFAIPAIQTLTRRAITDEILERPLPEFVSTTTPSGAVTGARLRLRALSPVSADLFDSFGNHTGRAASGASSTAISSAASTSDLILVEEKIPNSYYLEFGEGKYLGVGIEEGGGAGAGFSSATGYTLVLIGEATGTFNLEIDEVVGGAIVGTTTFRDVPVLPDSRAILEFREGIDTLGELEIDMDGDGGVDFSISESDATDPLNYLALVRAAVKNSAMGQGIRTSLVAQLNTGERLLKSGRNNSASNIFSAAARELRVLAAPPTGVASSVLSSRVLITPKDALGLAEMFERMARLI